MKQFLHIVVGAVVLSSLITGIVGQTAADGDLQKLGREFIPDGMEPAHKTVKGRFAESASWDGSEHVVVLWKPVSGLRFYDGAVVLARRADSFEYRAIPQPESRWSMMEPIAIFFANADGDTENELLIIDECYTGIGPEGARPFYRTRVYDWNGNLFTHLDPVSEKIGNVRTVAAARARLRQLSKTLTQKTEMQVRVDWGSHNLTIDKAASAGEAWVKEPAQIIARTFGGFSEMRSKTVEFVAPTADGADTLTVTITSDGLMDDSVRGEKFRLELKADKQGVWKFTSAGKSWRCQPGRGNQDFSITKCS
jgi:hypothetical protein